MDLWTWGLGGGEGRTNWESGIDIYTQPSVKQLVGSCHIAQELSSVLSDDLEGWYGGGGEAQEEGEYAYI